MLATPGLVPHLADGRTNVLVRRAAADVAAHPLPDLRVAGGVPLVEQRGRGHDLPGRAVPALERVVLDERLLHRVQLAFPGEPLDGRDLVALAGDRQGEARQNPAAVHPHGARTTGALIAALL